jgi:acetyl-CoA/propionyl-CoA carboxylase biotin carboxyl carrier protein
MLRALDEFRIDGITTTIPAHRVLLEDLAFVDGTYSTRTVEGGALEGLAQTPVPGTEPAQARSEALLDVGGTPVHLWHPALAGSISADSRAAPRGARLGEILSPMHGTILEVLVAVGDEVETGDPIAVLEAMKMETRVAAASAGRIDRVSVGPAEVVEAGQVIAVLVPAAEAPA